MKRWLKQCVFSGGEQPRKVLTGPARGLSFIIDPETKTQRLLGLDERELSKTLARLIDSAATFIDVGASDGYYTIMAAKRNPRLVAIGCEPAPQLGERFREHCRLNSLDGGDRVRWHSELVGTRHLPLDLIAAGCPGPIAVKIDVEGGETDVLDSGANVLGRSDASFVIETHSAEAERDCRVRLEAAGYHCRVVKNAWWRVLIPEQRLIEHNRWLVAERPESSAP